MRMYTFFETEEAAAVRYDPQFREACELYNRSLAVFVKYSRENNLKAKDGLRLPLLVGNVEIDRSVHSELPWKPEEYEEHFPAYDLEVKGLLDHVRSYGIGVPLVVVRAPFETAARREEDRYLPQSRLAHSATALLRFTSPVCGGADDGATQKAEVELYDPMKTDEIQIGGRTVSLESDLTTPLAYALKESPSIKGITGLLDVSAWESRQGLYMLQPYEPGKIPVVFVHGLMSAPPTWLPMFNSLLSDHRIRHRYQFWFFMYPTGNPILYSASLLRDSLAEVRASLDPDGADPTLDQMVLVAHSMGGLLSKTTVQDSGDVLWSSISSKSVDDLELPDEERRLVKKLFFYKPLPFVRRVIFLAVPHRGSRIAEGLIGRLGSSLVRLPEFMVKSGRDVLLALGPDADRLPKSMSESKMTGIDALRPDNPALRTLTENPFNAAVTIHSIIGNHEVGGTPGGTDTVVPYESSHLAGAVSELILRSKHSVHKHPSAILEVRRILLKHLETVDAAKAGQRVSVHEN